MLRLTRERLARQLSQTELAALARMAQGDVSNIETQRRGRVRRCHLERLARVLNVDPPEALLEDVPATVVSPRRLRQVVEHVA